MSITTKQLVLRTCIVSAVRQVQDNLLPAGKMCHPYERSLSVELHGPIMQVVIQICGARPGATNAVCCRSGRQPVLEQTKYDALLFALHLPGPPAPSMWEALSSSLSQHLRSLTMCSPFAPRRKVHRYQGHASRCVALPVPGRLQAPSVSAEHHTGHPPAWLKNAFKPSNATP